MIRTAAFLTGVVFLAFSTAARGEDTKVPADEYLQLWTDYFCGDWTTTTVAGDDTGDEKIGTKGTWSCRLGATKTCMHFASTRGGNPRSNAIAGYDPKSKAWKEIFFFADGSHLTQFYRAASGEFSGNPVGKHIKGSAEFVYPDGSVEVADIQVRFLGPDKCEYSATNRRIGTEKAPDLVGIFERKKN